MKTALVTGGGSGIGPAVAGRLRADGCHVATIDPTSAETDAAARELFRRFTDISFEYWKKIVDVDRHGIVDISSGGRHT